MNYKHRKSGITLTEVLVVLGMVAIIASFSIPKFFSGKPMGQKERALIRETFSLVGESFLTRMNQPGLPAVDIGGTENDTFGDYLYSHLNYLTTTVNDPAVTNNYCPAADYFVMPGGTIIRSICDVNAATDQLHIDVYIPGRRVEHDLTYTIVIPEGQDRYTTLHGFDSGGNPCIPLVDETLNIVDTCP